MRTHLVILSVVSMLLAACGGAPTAIPAVDQEPTAPSIPVGEVVRIRFAVYDWDRSRFENQARAFEADNPDVQIGLVSIEEILGLTLDDFTWPEDAWVRLSAGADAFSLPPNRDAARQSLLRDLTPFIDASATFLPGDFYPDTLTQYQWDGGTWGLPTAINYQILYYDKTAFDQAGAHYPEPGWTWDDFLAAAQALTARDGDTVARWGFVEPWPSHLPVIEGRVRSLIDASTDPPAPRFDQPDVIRAVQWYAALYLDYRVAPYFGETNPSGQILSQGEQLIEQGQAAMWHGNSASWRRHQQQNTQVKLGAAVYPVDEPDSHTTPMTSEGLSMSAATTQPNAAWRWLDYLSHQVLYDLNEPSQLLPARRSVAESGGFWDQVDEELARALRYAIDHSYASASQPGYDAIVEALDAILKGEKSVEEALAEAQVQAEADIREASARQAQATPVPTVSVAGFEGKTSDEARLAITFLVAYGDIDLAVYRGLVKRFREANLDIDVQVTAPGPTSGPLTVPGAAQVADCFVQYPDFHDPRNLAAIFSLNPFLDADPSFPTADFYPALLDRFTVDGKLWALPVEIEPYVIEYNKAVFDAAGIAYPSTDRTMDDFLALAIALTKGEGESKQYGFVGQADEGTLLQLMLERRGARLIDDSVDPPRVAFDDPATIATMRWYIDLYTRHAVKPVFLRNNDFDDIDTLMSAFLAREALIDDGRAAMWTRFGGQPAPGARDRYQSMDIGVAPLPIGTGNAPSSSYQATGGYFISANTQARQACWQWITFLTAQPEVAQGLPSRRSVAESDAYRQRVGGERAAAYLASLGDSDPFARLEGRDSWLGSESGFWLLRAYLQAMEGEATVEQALAAAQQMADDYRACVIARDALFDWRQQETCVREIDPTFPDSYLIGSSEP